MPAPGALIGFVPVTDSERARHFYTEVLGLEFVADDGFAVVLRSNADGGSNMVRIVKMPEVKPLPFTILGWESKAIEADVARLSARGITFLRFSFLEQDAAGIWTAPDGDRVAWFQDPDGNTLSLSQHTRAGERASS